MDSDSPAAESPIRIVFVCTGNRARSAFAEALLRRHTADAPIAVLSRGTMDLGPLGALPEMMRAAERFGVDLAAHRAAPIAPGELAGADLVLGFEPFHVAASVVDGGAPPDRTFTLREFVELASHTPGMSSASLQERIVQLAACASACRRDRSPLSAPSISDPYGVSPTQFAETASLIGRLVDQLAILVLQPRDAPAAR